MPLIDGYAGVRLRPVSLDAIKPRPCDVEVSSDGGKTWKVMLTEGVKWEDSTITISFPVKLTEGN